MRRLTSGTALPTKAEYKSCFGRQRSAAFKASSVGPVGLLFNHLCTPILFRFA